MRQLKVLLLALGTLTVSASLSSTTAFAEEIKLGKQSKDRISEACKQAGGEQLSSASGAYGCEVKDKGTMILCTKENECTGYVPAKTRPARQRVLDSLELEPIAAPDDLEPTEAPEERDLELASE